MTKDVKEKLEKELKGLPKRFAVQIETVSENYPETLDTSLAFLLSNTKGKGIYVTLNKPISMLSEYLAKNKVDTKRLFFIDGISGASERRDDPNQNFVVLSGPTALTELSIEITKAKETGEFDFIFFDALSTLLIYNSAKRTLQFSYFLLTKLKDYNLSGIIIYLKSELEKEVFDSVTHLSDKVIRV